MSSDTHAAQELLKHSSHYGIALSERQASLLIKHVQLVIEKNAQVNLTRIDSLDDALIQHALDSLLILPVLAHLGLTNGRFVDIGTGAGFPGIPLAISTTFDAVLVDSVGKKIAAVNDFIMQLGLKNAAAVSCRVEDLARTEPCSFDLVVARAVSSIATLCEYASPLLDMNAYLVLYKAHPSCEEFSDGMAASQICGLSYMRSFSFELPYGYGHRELLVFCKTQHSRIRLPRQNGLAKRKPLHA